jgi:hypothetical protein
MAKNQQKPLIKLNENQPALKPRAGSVSVVDQVQRM